MAALDSAPFTWSPGWQVSAAGADPPEPADPFAEPAGVLTFPYTGDELYLLLRPGDYWAYLYVTVDGVPANRLPLMAGNDDSRGQPGGYRTLLAPERGVQDEPLPVLVHAAGAAGEHTARVEFWRGWGQTPLAGVAVDPLDGAGCAPAPLWPWVLVGALGVWGIGLGGWWLANSFQEGVARLSSGVNPGGPFQEGGSRTPFLEGAGVTSPWNNFPGPFLEGIVPPTRKPLLASAAAGLGLGLVIAGAALGAWWLCAPGLLLLGLAGLLRPAWWLGALLFGLPFAFGVKLPLLPNRAFDLIDLGVWGGIAVLLGHWLLLRWGGRLPGGPPPGGGSLPIGGESARAPAALNWPLLALAAVTTWALVSAAAADYPDLALREWRVVFLNPLLFGGLLALTFTLSAAPWRERWLLVTAWLAGGALVSLFGLWGYVTGNEWVSQAEGVRRVQAFYGSGNNLALYLDRTLAVALALALFAPRRRAGGGGDLQEVSPPRWLWASLAAPMALAWLLTFSKGSLLLAGPALALVLLVGGGSLLRREGRSLRPLWLLLGVGVLALLALAPFLGTERFQRLLDFSGGTGFLRLQLWRSAWAMALDHPFLGVGPDNFLYAYRSGYLLPGAWQEPNLNHPHNLLLDWWTRLGLPGLLLGLAWLGSGVYAAWRWLRSGPERALALGVLAACAAGLAHGLIDVSYALPDLMIVWVLLFGLGVRRNDSQRPAR